MIEGADPHWEVLDSEVFVGQRKDLRGPSTWKWVVPVISHRGGIPDEIFSAIRGSGALSRDTSEGIKACLHALRHGGNHVQHGWREFHGSVPRLAGHAVCHVTAREELDFDGCNPLCRRIGYRVAADRQRIEVRLEICLRSAFALMLQCLRFPALDLAAEWRITDGPPTDVGAASAGGPFRLLDNLSDEMHEQPPDFRHALWPAQQRSLQWMVYRERAGAPLVLEFRRYWRRERDSKENRAAIERSLAAEWCLDCRVLASFCVRGGVLADQIGYGKTALIIALLAARHCDAVPEPSSEDADAFFPSAATLICVPSNLHQQWLDELSKFTGSRFRVLPLRTIADLAHATVRELASADVVVCNYQLLWAPAYEKRRSELVASARSSDVALGAEQRTAELAATTYEEVFGAPAGKASGPQLAVQDLRRGTRSFLRESQRHPWGAWLQEGGGGSWPGLSFPVLEQLFWRRVVFDEFHELEALPLARRLALQDLRSHYRWGLTGTPLLASARHVAFMASLLCVDVAGPMPDPKEEQAARWPGDTDRVTVENCCRFLDACVRQNTAPALKLQTREHLVLVRHTPQERALYLAASCEAPPEVPGQSAEQQRQQALLILCSHFGAEQLRSASAGEECGRVLRMREEAVRAAEGALRSTLSALEAFSALLGRPRAELPREQEEPAVREVAESARRAAQEPQRLELRGSQSWKASLRRALAAKGEEEEKPSRKELESGLAACGEAAERELSALLAAVGQRRFLQKTLSLVSEGSERSARACSICFEEDLALEQLGITPCAHVFCLACLGKLVAKSGKCGICRQELGAGDVRPLMLEMEEEEAGPVRQEQKAAEKQLLKYGTKLGKIVTCLRSIKSRDASAKCIVFCQWQSLLQKIAAAFEDFAIRHAQLQGSVYSRTRTLEKFRSADSGVDVLLLSLEHSASGTNLTCASHVLLVHPMSAATQEQAVAFELQAIGRVRRWGQRHREVHVWRFCTAGTVEEEITRRHQREIWQRGSEEAEEEEHPAPRGKKRAGEESEKGAKGTKGARGAASAAAAAPSCSSGAPPCKPSWHLRSSPAQPIEL